MAFPRRYSRLFDYQGYQNANPTRPLPGVRVNVDLNDVKRVTDETIDFLGVSFQADGNLSASVLNGIVINGASDVLAAAIAATAASATSAATSATSSAASAASAAAAATLKAYTSYAAAVAATVGAGTTLILVENYYSGVVGGFGVWIKGTASAVTKANLVTADGFTFVYAPLANIDPKALGAKGDLSQDDTPFIQAAVDFAAGRRVKAPIGRYKMSSGVVYDAGPINLVGEGSGAAVVGVNVSNPPYGDLSPTVEDNNCTQFVAYFSAGDVFSSTSHHPCIFEDFQINTAAANVPRSSGAGIRCSGAPAETLKFKSGVRVTNVAFLNQYDGLAFCRPYMPVVSACFFGGWVHFGAHYYTTAPTEGGGGTITGCDFWGNSGSTTQTSCISTEIGYIDIRDNLLLGTALGVYINIQNGSAGAIRVRDNWIENQGNYGIYAGAVAGNTAAMFEFSGNEFSNGGFVAAWAASITIADYPNAGADWLWDVIIKDNVHRHPLTGAVGFVNVQTGKNVLIQNEVIENSGLGVNTFGISVAAVAGTPLKAPVQILDCQFIGTFANRYLGNVVAVIRDSTGMLVADLPTCAPGSRIYATNAKRTSNTDPTVIGGGAGGWCERNGSAWHTLQPA